MPHSPPRTAEPIVDVQKSGHVALVGRPNVGKSTLLNALVGEALSIVTPRPETTRDRVMAVVTLRDHHAQMVVVDTPGIHRPHRKLGEYMNGQARAAVDGADVVVMVADATDGHVGPSRDAHVIEALAGVSHPVLLALNKVDRFGRKGDLLPLLVAYEKLRPFATIIPVSAATKDGLDRLVAEVVQHLPPGPALYPLDTLTDRSERFFVGERIREAVIAETGEEIPYVTAVEIESYDERLPLVRIVAVVHVERPGQKKILVGTGGERVKAIGSRARVAIERLIGRRVYLDLRVKVTPDWTRTPEVLARFGYSPDSGRSKS